MSVCVDCDRPSMEWLDDNWSHRSRNEAVVTYLKHYLRILPWTDQTMKHVRQIFGVKRLDFISAPAEYKSEA